MARRDADYWRQNGKAVYRLLRDRAGAAGMTAGEIGDALSADDGSSWPKDRVFMTLNWLRTQGVDVVCARAGDGTSPSRWALRTLLPESWDTMLPA